MKINNKSFGFTIVELLIVIVIIGILAAITIVSYTGITARANTVASQSSANAAIAKASIYFAEKGVWPSTYALLTTSASSSDTWDLNGVSFVATANLQALASAPANNSTVLYEVCGVNAAAASTSYATVTNITGIKVDYWKYDGTPSSQSLTAGTTSGTVNTYNVTCWSSAT